MPSPSAKSSTVAVLAKEVLKLYWGWLRPFWRTES